MRFKIKEKKVAKRLGVAVEVDGTLYFNLWQQAAYFSAKTWREAQNLPVPMVVSPLYLYLPKLLEWGVVEEVGHPPNV